MYRSWRYVAVVGNLMGSFTVSQGHQVPAGWKHLSETPRSTRYSLIYQNCIIILLDKYHLLYGTRCAFLRAYLCEKPLIISNLICARATASHASLGARYHEVAEDHDLTQREEEILYLLAQERRAADIAEALTVGVSTTRSHIKHIHSKLGAHSRKELLELVGGCR